MIQQIILCWAAMQKKWVQSKVLAIIKTLLFNERVDIQIKPYEH